MCYLWNLYWIFVGKWIFFDFEIGLGVVNRFDVNEVERCYVNWGFGFVIFEFWLKEWFVLKDIFLFILYEYDLIDIYN